jgi:hypothetical protein
MSTTPGIKIVEERTYTVEKSYLLEYDTVHSIIFQKMGLLIFTDARTSRPTT